MLAQIYENFGSRYGSKLDALVSGLQSDSVEVFFFILLDVRYLSATDCCSDNQFIHA